MCVCVWEVIVFVFTQPRLILSYIPPSVNTLYQVNICFLFITCLLYRAAASEMFTLTKRHVQMSIYLRIIVFFMSGSMQKSYANFCLHIYIYR